MSAGFVLIFGFIGMLVALAAGLAGIADERGRPRWIFYLLAQVFVFISWADFLRSYSSIHFFAWLALATISLFAGVTLLIRERRRLGHR